MSGIHSLLHTNEAISKLSAVQLRPKRAALDFMKIFADVEQVLNITALFGQPVKVLFAFGCYCGYEEIRFC